MKINYNNFKFIVLKEKIQNVFDTAISETNVLGKLSVNITIVSENEIKYLNNEFRHIDKVTDVLSFPLLERKELLSLKVEDTADIGDIVICSKRAKQQAKEYEHSLEREICFLCLHGLLHLLGYDHIIPIEEKEMFGLADKILKKCEIMR